MSVDYSIDELVPHSGRMSLLDRVVDFSENDLRARVCIKQQSTFLNGDSVPVSVGVEYMAQAIAAFSGMHQRQKNLPVKIGLLASVRKFSTNCAGFPLGAELEVAVQRLSGEINGLSTFQCAIDGEDIEVCARITVYMPDDAETFFERSA